jgi:hypothetical protein
MIIAFSGSKFAGKDTAAEVLINKFKFERIGLADKLKDMCSEVFEINRQDMDNPDLKEKAFEDVITISSGHVHRISLFFDNIGFFFEDFKYKDICKDFIGKNLTSIRNMLQVVGTDICRTHLKDDIWLDCVVGRINSQKDKSFVITDARFKNERKFLQEAGATLILVKRPGFEPSDGHISENQLGDENDYDVIVDNCSTITALQSDIHMWFSIMKDEIQNKNKSNNKR